MCVWLCERTRFLNYVSGVVLQISFCFFCCYSPLDFGAGNISIHGLWLLQCIHSWMDHVLLLNSASKQGISGEVLPALLQWPPLALWLLRHLSFLVLRPCFNSGHFLTFPLDPSSILFMRGLWIETNLINCSSNMNSASLSFSWRYWVYSDISTASLVGWASVFLLLVLTNLTTSSLFSLKICLIYHKTSVI